jgi:hypothetical protein
VHRLFVKLGVAAMMVSAVTYADVGLSPPGDGHLVLPVFVNGKGPFPFILDTGADGSGFYHWFAVQQKLRAGKPEELVGMTGSTTVPTYKVKSLTVDRHTIRNVVGDSFPDRHDAGKQAGIIGNDFMDGEIVVFDFPCNAVKIIPKPVNIQALLESNAAPVEAGSVRNGTQLTLPVMVNGVEGVAVLDTGSRDTRINSHFAAAAGIDPTSSTFRDADIIYGVNSRGMPSRKGPVGTVWFAGVEVHDAEARVMDLSSYETFGIAERPAMTLGLDLMQGYRLIYDHEAKHLWFRPSACGNRADAR